MEKSLEATVSSSAAERVLIDWGTTNARAYRLAADGTLRDSRRLARGIRQVPAGGFPAALEELLGPWRSEFDTAPEILMSGMVGSRQGWIEAPYVPCPARLDELARRLCTVPEAKNVRIVPGICRGTSNDRHDVMRGEEVQVFGAAEAADRALLCLPGTHSKWVLREHDAIVDFATAMTGEVFQVLRQHSLLGALMTSGAEGDGPPSEVAADCFRRGLDRSGEPGGMLHHLFGVRAEGLFDAVPTAGLEAYLSGILIGHEIRAVAGLFAAAGPVRLVAGGRLAEAYEAAFRHLGMAVETVDVETATLRGLARILERAGAPA